MKKVTLEKIQERLVELLQPGIENAKSKEYLASAIGCSISQVRKAIKELRKSYPICSCIKPGGYWLATTADEVREFAMLLLQHIEGYECTYNRMRSHLENMR